MNPNIAKRISLRRRQLGMSQSDLAAAIGVTKQAISNYEKGIRTPDFELLEYMTDALHTNLGYLIGSSNDPSPRPSPEYEFDSATQENDLWRRREELRRDPKRRMLLALAENGTDKDVDAAVALIDALKAANPDFYDGDDPA